jgi:hypothetical protein
MVMLSYLGKVYSDCPIERPRYPDLLGFPLTQRANSEGLRG